ncbi:MAG: hypothetical protein WDN75_07745 [Bacteroidota bacterium]
MIQEAVAFAIRDMDKPSKGRIVLSTFKSGSRSLTQVRELSEDEASTVRLTFNLDSAWR